MERALKHPLRARIYQALLGGEASAAEIARSLRVPVPNVSYHVRALADAGLIVAARTTRKRGAVETHFRARARRSGGREHWTPARRRALLGPLVEEVIEGIDVEDVLEEQQTVLFFEADEVDAPVADIAAERLIEWSLRLRELEAEAWSRNREAVRWYGAPAWLGLGQPPPGASRLALVHPRGDELDLRPPAAHPHERALPARRPSRSVVDLADASEHDLLLHPLRMRIFRLLHSPGSATELSKAMGESVPTISYHIGVLREAGLVEVVDEVRRRGAVETYYLSTYALEILEPEWNALSATQRKRFLRTAQRESVQSMRHVTATGGFDDPRRSVLLRAIVRLDPPAAKVAADHLMQLHLDLAALAQASANPTTPITFGAGLLVLDPLPGQRMEVRRHAASDEHLFGGSVDDADPTSASNPPPVAAAAR